MDNARITTRAAAPSLNVFSVQDDNRDLQALAVSFNLVKSRMLILFL